MYSVIFDAIFAPDKDMIKSSYFMTPLFITLLLIGGERVTTAAQPLAHEEWFHQGTLPQHS